jgi:hypothetical protein
MTPLKSLEQLGALGVFGILQLMYLSDLVTQNIQDPKASSKQILKVRATVFASAAVSSLYPYC